MKEVCLNVSSIENTFIIKIAENTKVETVRAAISQVLENDEIPSDLETVR